MQIILSTISNFNANSLLALNTFYQLKPLKIIRGMFLLCFVICSIQINALELDSLDSYTRTKVSLNGQWRYIVDPYENGFYNYRWQKFDEQEFPSKNAFFMDAKVHSKSELLEYNFDEADFIMVPSDWNTQDARLYFYEGTVWYRTEFEQPVHKENDRTILRFGAVNYQADVYLNGKKLGTHLGGFTPFFFDVSDVIRPEKNSLVVKVDNKRGAQEVPTLNTDWWNYGGITRDVDLIVLPQQFIQHFQSQLQSVESRKLTVNVQLAGATIANTHVEMTVPELNLTSSSITNNNGLANFSITLPKFTPWSPSHPKRYKVRFNTASDTLTDDIGFRTIETKGKAILLNGEKVFLKGISLHEEYAQDGGGRVKNAAQSRELLESIKELNANYVRLAHYPHSENTVRIAEELGLLVWSEIPVYWTIDWTNPNTYQKAQKQLKEMIKRDRNRAAVIIWSIANETPVNKHRTLFLSKLATKARQLDSTRLISAAMEKHYDERNENLAIVTDPLSDIVDIVSFNQYIGWYEGVAEKLGRTSWSIPYNKPVIISEFGAGALEGFHGNSDERWTEEFQADVYLKTFEMLQRIDGWSGVSPWILRDFRSPRRIHGKWQKDFNRKGIISEAGKKKLAFKTVEQFYNEMLQTVEQ